MSQESEPELNELETALSRLVPRQPDWNRDRLLFAAGQARTRRWVRLLLAGNFLLICLSLYLANLLLFRPVPPTRIQYIQVPPPVPTPQEGELEFRGEEPGPKPAQEPVVPSAPGEDWPGRFPPSYGTIRARISTMGEGALPTHGWGKPAGTPERMPLRVGERPALFEPFLFGR